jgi:hypothetical protein
MAAVHAKSSSVALLENVARFVSDCLKKALIVRKSNRKILQLILGSTTKQEGIGQIVKNYIPLIKRGIAVERISIKNLRKR